MLGMSLAYAWFSSGGSSLIPISSYPFVATTTGITSQQIPESGVVSAAGQPAGDSVVVESITVPPPGVWAAVREVNGNDLGNVLGAARVNGPRSSVVVPLLRATESGRPYAVELYRYDGNDSFDLASLSVYVDFNTGAPAVAYFTTTN